jgi:hypothetical protein
MAIARLIVPTDPDEPAFVQVTLTVDEAMQLGDTLNSWLETDIPDMGGWEANDALAESLVRSMEDINHNLARI